MRTKYIKLVEVEELEKHWETELPEPWKFYAQGAELAYVICRKDGSVNWKHTSVISPLQLNIMAQKKIKLVHNNNI